MRTQTIDLKDVPIQLQQLVHRVMSGEQVVLSENNKPVAQIVPLRPRVAGLHRGSIWTSDDFDAPLPEDLGSEGQ